MIDHKYINNFKLKEENIIGSDQPDPNYIGPF